MRGRAWKKGEEMSYCRPLSGEYILILQRNTEQACQSALIVSTKQEMLRLWKKKKKNTFHDCD